MTNVCKVCHKPFIPKKPGYVLCPRCYLKASKHKRFNSDALDERAKLVRNLA